MKNIGLIALDLDGTLLDSQKRLSPRNKEVLSRCAQAGIQIVPTTGRAVDGIVPAVRALPGVRYAITTNGAVVADLSNGSRMNKCTMSNEKALELISIIKEFRVMYDPYIDGRGISQPEFIEHMEEYGLSNVMQKMVRTTRDVVPDIPRYVLESKKEVEKINIYLSNIAEKEIIRSKLSAVEGIIISSSLYNNLEINAVGATKGDALRWLAEHLAIEQEETMAFGDGENDISMLKAAGIGVAMENGLEEVKAASDEITLTNDQDGVAAAIERIIFT